MKEKKLVIYPKMLYLSSIRVVKGINRFPKIIYYEDKYLTTTMFTKLKREKINGFVNGKTIGHYDINNGACYRRYLDREIIYYYINQKFVTAGVALANFICDECNGQEFDIHFLNYLASIITNKIDDINTFYNLVNYLKTDSFKVFDKQLIDECYEEYINNSNTINARKVLEKTRNGFCYII